MVKTATEVGLNLLKIENQFLKQQANISLKEADNLLSEAKRKLKVSGKRKSLKKFRKK